MTGVQTCALPICSYKQIVRECTKVNKARAKAEAKEAKARAKAAAKEAKARAKACTHTLQTCTCGALLSKNQMAKHLRSSFHQQALSRKEASRSTGLRREHTPTEQLQARLAKLDAEMDQLSRRMAADRARATMQRDLQRIDQKRLMQELASAHREIGRAHV